MFWKLKNNFNYFLNTFLDLIYKKKCIICSCAKTDDLLCKNCLKDVNYLSVFAHKIYKNIPIYSAMTYDKNTKKLIHMLKFQHKKQSAIVLAHLVFQYFKKLNLNKDLIITYPSSHYLRCCQRGYDHMYLIIKEFSKITNIPFKKDLIKKIKHTKPQYKAKNKYKNIKNSFKINQKHINDIKNKTILLIDDIITTGATIEEIINCFQKENIKNIICLTISKAV